MDRQIARVVIENTAEPADIEATARPFRQVGFAGPIEPVYGRHSAELLPWIVHVTLAAPIAAYLTAIGAEAGKDTYAAAKQWIRSVWAARREASGREGTLHLTDPNQSHLILTSTLPDEALDALAALDWPQVEGAYLVWDDQRKLWWDPTAAAALQRKDSQANTA